MIVSLHGVAFFAYHGFYPEEQKIGNHFLIDVDVEFLPLADLSPDELDHTVNYEWLYDMLTEEMQTTRKLIETVAQAIIERIISQYPFAERAQVKLKKLNPLIGAKTQYAMVNLIYTR